jgi:hypothetical protein
MRSRAIEFRATGMRPNTRVFAYFDRRAVSQFCTPTDSTFTATGALGGALITDDNGNVFGIFNLPPSQFRMGERPFMLVDINNLDVQGGTETTSATTKYVALGLTGEQRGITFSTREATVTSETVTDSRTETSIVDVNVNTIVGVRAPEIPDVSDFVTQADVNNIIAANENRGGDNDGGGNEGRDPLAQTFTIGEFEFDPGARLRSKFGVSADGIFLSGIDLYFQQVGEIAQGVSLEIREVLNGQITTNRVPFGLTRVLTTDINVSDDASVPTPFYFDSPVYLRGNEEYAFIVRPDGNDQGFRVWIAELGADDVQTGELIDQQPAVGILFTSANDRTYVPRQNQDVKFTLYRAQFQDVTGTAFLQNQDDEYLNLDQISTTRFTAGETIRGESIIALTSNTAALTLNDFVSVGANTGQIRKIISNTGPVFAADVKGNFNNGDTVTFTNASGSFTGVVNTFTANAATGSVQNFNRVKRLMIANNSSGSFTSNTTNNDGFYRGQTSNASAQVTGVREFKYNVLTPKISFAKFGGADIAWAVKTTSNNFVIDSTFTSIEASQDNVFRDEEKVVAGKTAEDDNTSGNKTLTIRGTLTSDSNRVSPFIDVGLTKGVIATHNIINNLNTSEHLDNGDSNVRYISKEVVLADGQDAEDIKVVLSAYKPSGTEIDVYARIKAGSDNEAITDKHYTKLTQETALTTLSSITNKNDFFEIEYGFPSANATSLGAFNDSNNSDIVTYRNSANSVFTTYKTFQVKIVLRSSAGSHVYPTVRDLRAIALQI